MGIFHLDIKPENVLCTSKQTPLYEKVWIFEGDKTEDKEKEKGKELKLW